MHFETRTEAGARTVVRLDSNRMPVLGLLLIWLSACNSFFGQSLLPFIQVNSQRIIENANIQRDLSETDLAVILSYFREPATNAEKIRQASLTLLQRSKADVQLRYFDVLVYALEDPSAEVRDIATAIFVAQRQNPLWYRRLQHDSLFQQAAEPIQNLGTAAGDSVDLQEIEGFRAAVRQGLAERKDEEPRWNRSLTMAASLLKAPLSPLQVRYLIARYSSNPELRPYLAPLFIRSHPLVPEQVVDDSSLWQQNSELWRAFALLPATRSEATQKSAAESAAESDKNLPKDLPQIQNEAQDNGENSANKPYYLILAQADSAQKILFLLSCQLLAKDLVAQLHGLPADAPAQERVALLKEQSSDLLQNAFYFVQDGNLQVRRKVSELLSQWPNFSTKAVLANASGETAGIQIDAVSEYLVQQLEQLPQLKPNQLSLIFDILGQRKANNVQMKILVRYYQLNLAGPKQKAYMQYFHRQSLPFAEVYMAYLSQNAGLADGLNIAGGGATAEEQLALFWQLEEIQQSEIVQIYFYGEQELQARYREFFTPFLLRAIQLQLNDLLRSFFSRTAYDVYQIYDTLRQTASRREPAAADQLTSSSRERLAILCQNVELLLQVIPDSLLYSLINWESLSYFKERNALTLALRYISLTELHSEPGFEWVSAALPDDQADDQASQETQGEPRSELARLRVVAQQNINSGLANDRRLWNNSLEQNAQGQWFLNWFKIYLVLLFRGVAPGEWPNWQAGPKTPTDAVASDKAKVAATQGQRENQEEGQRQEEASGPNLKNLPNLPATEQIWDPLLESYQAQYSQRYNPQLIKGIRSFAELFRNYRLWQAWSKYFNQPRSDSLAMYGNYVREVMALDEETKTLQLQLQALFLQPQASGQGLLELQRQLAELREQKQQQLQNFIQRRASQELSETKQATAIWQEYFSQARSLSEKLQFASNSEKVWFFYFFPEFDMLELQRLVRLAHQSDLLR